MPFVTEELWQKLPHEGPSLMVAPFPRHQEGWVSPDDIEHMEQLQELISAIRTARTENKVSPGKKVPCQLLCAEEDRTFLESQLHHISGLARLDSVDLVPALKEGGLQVQGVSGLVEFALLLDDVIDVEAERQRIRKQVTKLEADLHQLERKLQNQSFVEKAPPPVVEGVRTRLVESQVRLEKLRSQLDGLS